MMRGADVRSIQALEDLRATLLRFGADTEAALRAMEAELRRTLEYLAERRRHWEVKVRAAEEELRWAQAALAACRAGGYTDPRTGRTYIPPCPQEVAWVERAGRQLAEARARLREVLEWQRLVERSAADYHRQAQRMATWLQGELPKASGLLESKIRTLYAYTAIAPGGVFASVDEYKGISQREEPMPLDSHSILSEPAVLVALQQAWQDSQSGVTGGHEEGGFVLRDSTGKLSVARWPKGAQDTITLLSHSNCKIDENDIVATFHTHPNTGSDYLQEPS